MFQVFVWEDQDEDVVESYKTLEGHKSDVLAMAAYAPRQLLASGECRKGQGYELSTQLFSQHSNQVVDWPEAPA